MKVGVDIIDADKDDIEWPTESVVYDRKGCK